jgi:hypothetical protein
MYAPHRRRSDAMDARRIAGTSIMALMVALLATVASAQTDLYEFAMDIVHEWPRRERDKP